MLRAPDARVLDVAVACGFKTQQHFAQVFRNVCGISPTGYRQDFVGQEATCAPETCSPEIFSKDTPRQVIVGSQPYTFSRPAVHVLEFVTQAPRTRLGRCVLRQQF